MGLMKTTSRFGVVLLAIVVELIFNSFSPTQAINLSQKTIHYNLKSSEKGNLCFYLGQLKGTLDITLERGSDCHRFRILSTHLRRQYLKIANNASLESQLDLTLSPPRFGGIYDWTHAGITSYTNCSSSSNIYKTIHTVKDESSRTKNLFTFFYYAVLCLAIGLTCLFFLFKEIKKYSSMSRPTPEEVISMSRFIIIILIGAVLFFGFLGLNQALFTMKIRQLNEAYFCRLRVQSWE